MSEAMKAAQRANEMANARARESFVRLIKEENFYSDFCKQSLRQHWNGKGSGFADEMVHRRWLDFLAGWERAKKETS